MSRISWRATITYPPEMLPRAGEDDEVEVIVCNPEGSESFSLALPVESVRLSDDELAHIAAAGFRIPRTLCD